MLRHLPNALSIARILAAPVLVACAAAGNEAVFTWILVPALLSDIADGLIARVFRLQSPLGATLDSVADLLLLLAAFYGIWVFYPGVVADHALVGTLLIGAWLVQAGAALLRYGRLSSFHTYLSKLAGYLLGIFVGVWFVFGFQPWLMYLAAGVSILGNVEELVLLALLPTWRPDVRGLWWLLRERRAGTAP
jgi:CDP-diacylglycerol--glycerol-3-phosphate 3-phosphatidyltransferase